jgi:hypothetical protein
MGGFARVELRTRKRVLQAQEISHGQKRWCIDRSPSSSLLNFAFIESIAVGQRSEFLLREPADR